MWQFLCGEKHQLEDAVLVSLKELFELDQSIGLLCEMAAGFTAERKAGIDSWHIRKG